MTRPRHRRPLLVLVLATAVLVGLVPSSASADVDTVDTVRVRLDVVTSSDWTVVRLLPGEVLAAAVLSSTGADVQRAGAAWSVRPTGEGWAHASIDAVLHDPGARALDLVVEKGWVGATRVTVTDVQRDVQLTTTTNRVQSTTDPSNRTRVSVPASTVWVEPLDLPRTATDPLVLAFQYPWFADYEDPALTEHPAHPVSSFDREAVSDETLTAKDAGVDGFVVSWAGEQANGYALDLAVDAAEDHGQLVTGYLETVAAGDGPTAWAWLQSLMERSSSPAFLRHDGVPVVFVYGMQELPAWMWGTMRNTLARQGTPVLLVGDTGEAAYDAVTAGEHRYAAPEVLTDAGVEARRRTLVARARTAVEGAPARLSVATVAPGYDDHLVRDGNPVIDREDGDTYVDSWAAARAADPDWVVVTSWNEWFEGTSIAASAEHGVRELDTTVRQSDAWQQDVRRRYRTEAQWRSVLSRRYR